MCDTLKNPVPNANHWFAYIKKGDKDVTLELKQLFLPNISMIEIN